MHYRSVMVLGTCTVVTGTAKREALRVITEHLMPGRWDDVRAPHTREVAATTILALSLNEASVKISDSQPDDLDEDIAGPAWAGVVPMRETYGRPTSADDLSPGIAIPSYVKTWKR